MKVYGLWPDFQEQQFASNVQQSQKESANPTKKAELDSKIDVRLPSMSILCSHNN